MASCCTRREDCKSEDNESCLQPVTNPSNTSNSMSGSSRTPSHLISEPFDGFEGWPERSLIWESKRPYCYFRTTSDGRAIVGGEDVPFATAHKSAHGATERGPDMKGGRVGPSTSCNGMVEKGNCVPELPAGRHPMA